MNRMPHSKTMKSVALLMLAVGMIAGEGWTVSPETWEISSYSELAEGESERISILHPGEIMLSPSLSAYAAIRESAIWSLAESPDGQTLYLGTGNSAKIYKTAVSADSATAEAKLFADLDGNAIYALLATSSGDLFAGVSPGGNVYKINADGATTLIGSSGQDYIWGMVQNATGDLILATGDQGQIVQMSLEGKTKTLFKTGEKHILSLVADANGAIYFGTSSNGLVAVVEGKDYRVLYDSDLNEVKSLSVGADGSLYAAIVPTVQVEPKREAPAPASPAPAAKSDKTSEIVRISPNGQVKVLDKTAGSVANCLLSNGNKLLVGTGEEGKLFQTGYREELDLLSDLDVSEILTIHKRQPEGYWLGTGNPAKLFQVPQTTAKGGVYASKALDAKVISQWGEMTWTASVPEGATLAFQTRSGNSKEPNDNWSDWSKPMEKPGRIESPSARYLQWRAKLGGNTAGATARILEVAVIHQSINIAPTIESLQVGDQSSSSETASSSAKTADAGASKSTTTASSTAKSSSEGGSSSNGSLAISWKAADPNGDTLSYALAFRRINETTWKEIEKDLKAAKFSWSTEALPDGEYEARLTATDRLSNPLASSATDELQSEPFIIDKTAPEVVEWKNKSIENGVFSAEVLLSDKTSRIQAIDYVLDGDDKHPETLLPVDGIPDSREETVQIRIENLKAGERSIAVRIEDEKGNIGSDCLVITVP